MKKVMVVGILISIAFMMKGCCLDNIFTTPVKLTIYWPERASKEPAKVTSPSSALSATVTLVGAATDGSDFVFTVNRPGGIAAVLQEYQSSGEIHVGTYELNIVFYSDENGTGSIVGTAADIVTIDDDGEGIGEVTLQGTVSSVWVYANQLVDEGVSKTLNAVVRDQNANLLAVSPGSIFWSVVYDRDGVPSLRFENGQAVGIKHGYVVVRATVDGVASDGQDVLVTVVPYALVLPMFADSPTNGTSIANAVSGNGDVVVGMAEASDGHTEAFLWRKGDTNLTGLGVLEGYDNSEAVAVNEDGSIIIGNCETNDISKMTPFIWTASTGIQKLDTYFDSYDIALATDITADGRRIVGYFFADANNTLGFLWETGKDVVTFSDLLPVEIPKHKTILNGISDSGNQIVGDVGYNLSSDETTVYTQASVFLEVGSQWDLNLLGYTQGTPFSTASCISGDGSLIGGETGIEGSAGFFNPFLWTTYTGMYVNIAGQILTTQAISYAGDRVIGGGADPGMAYIYDLDYGYVTLISALELEGLTDTFTASPVSLLGLSADGQIMVGLGSIDTGDGQVFKAIYIEIP
jgi:probable HAF family extracellular repeat protein